MSIRDIKIFTGSGNEVEEAFSKWREENKYATIEHAMSSKTNDEIVLTLYLGNGLTISDYDIYQMLLNSLEEIKNDIHELKELMNNITKQHESEIKE